MGVPSSGFSTLLNFRQPFGVKGRTHRETNKDQVSRTSCSILVVEDHADSAALLERLLTRMGHTVATAACVREATALAAARRFDIVISDVGLPDGDGYALFRSVRAMYPVKGIAVTGYGTPDDLAACRQAGFEAHLVKPVMFDQLKTALDGLCHEERIRPAEV
jgi:CheY-like chemotaxis protein